MISLKSKSEAPKVDIDALETAHDAARAKVDAVRIRRDALNAERVRLEQRRWAVDLSERDELDDAARAVLEDPDSVIETDDLDRRIKKLAAELIVVDRALGIAREQRGEAAKKYANAVAAQLRPQHRKAVQRIAAALRELDAANREEAEIRSQVPGGGSGLPMAGYLIGGSLQHEMAPITGWFRYARSAGLLEG